MTVSYSAKVATAKFSCFFKLLMRWRGSIYKILWKEFIVFATAYFVLSFVYRCALTSTQKELFEKLSAYCSQFSNLIPVAFVLGFYVNHVASRWWEKFRMLPWPGRTAMFVTASLRGHDDRARLMRRTIMRYMCLSYVITMSSISPPVKKRFPTWKHMTEAGLMLLNEEKILENLKTPYNKFFVPLIWASELVMRARTEGRIKDDFAVKTLIDELNDFRTRSFQLFNFDWINIPLVYTQVVTLAVYTFFLSCLMGRQYLDNGQLGDMYFPFFTFLQFVFYIGWLKVAETMLNPFGEDDDDFDINYLIDRHLKVSYLVVDEMHAEHPQLIKDQYWDTLEFDLPYNAATEQFKQEPHLGSALDLNIPPEKTVYIPSSLQTVHEDFEEVRVDSARERTSNSRQKTNPLSVKSTSRSHRPTSNPRDIIASGVHKPNSRNVGASLPCTTNQFKPSDPRDITGASVPCINYLQTSSPRDIVVGSGRSTRRVARMSSSTARAPPLFRLASKTSINSQVSIRAGGFIRSLKRTFSHKNRQQSLEESDSEMMSGTRMKSKIPRTPSLASSCISNDIPTHAGHEHHHDDLLFHLSESDSDESTTSLVDKLAASKTILHRGQQSSKEDLRHHPPHHMVRSASDRRLESAPSTSFDHHPAKKCLKDAGRFKDDEVLFPIDEDPDGSVPDDRADQFLRDVQRQLTELHECQPPVAYGRQPSVEMEILNVLGTSVRSNVAH